MFVLDSTTRTLEVLLDAAPATSQLPVVVTYADTNFAGTSPWTPASSNTLTNGVTAATAVAAPAAGVQRQVEELCVRNDDTAARVVTLRYNDAGTFRRIVTATLQAGETLEYTHAAGLRTLADGAVKVQWTAPSISQGGGSVRVNADGSVTVTAAASGTTFSAGNVTVSYLTAGSIPFAGAGGLLSQDNANFQWDVANSRVISGGDFTTDGAANFLARGKTDPNKQLFIGYNSTADHGIIQSIHQTVGFTTLALNPNGGDVSLGGNLLLPAAGWVQSDPGRKRLTAPVTNATTTFSNLTDLTVTLVAGRKYTGVMAVRCSDSVAADGIKFDFNGGTATMTSFNAGVAGNVQGATAGVTVSAALATALNFTAMNGTTDHWIFFAVSLVCNAGGTFIPRVAQNAHSTGTATAALGSYLHLADSPN